MATLKHGQVIKMAYISLRGLFTSPAFLKQKAPRVLPVCHQVLNSHNAQYFTPFPQLSREEMEEPPPKVSDEVREVLEARRPSYDGTKWIPPKLKGWQFRRKRIELIQAGHYFPVLPMRDRMLDMMPKVQQHVISKEKRLVQIEENMKMMPQWINEYKERKRAEKLKKEKQKQEQKLNMMYIEKLGIHPEDPRAKQILASKTQGDQKVKKKKKFADIKKKKVEG